MFDFFGVPFTTVLQCVPYCPVVRTLGDFSIVWCALCMLWCYGLYRTTVLKECTVLS